MSRRHPATRAALAAGAVLGALVWVVLVVGGCIWAAVALDATFPSPQGGWACLFVFLGTGLLVAGPVLAAHVWEVTEWER